MQAVQSCKWIINMGEDVGTWNVDNWMLVIKEVQSYEDKERDSRWGSCYVDNCR